MSWAYRHGIEPHFIEPGTPNQNAFVEFVEGFNGRLRDQCLNEHWFVSLGQARQTIETWRLDHNAVRRHSALSDLPPEEFEQPTLDRATAPVIHPERSPAGPLDSTDAESKVTTKGTVSPL